MTDPAFDEFQDEADAKRIVIPYVPREHFRALHNSEKRWKFVVAHRRAGKSVACINELIKRALQNTRKHPVPRYAYVGPSFAQTKDLIWGYAKHFAGVLPGVKFSEGDLQVTLPNGAIINLYGGAAAYERMRGLYFDGIVLDEFSLLNPAVFSTVVRPCLADYRGFAVIAGTSNGDDHFHELKKKNMGNDSWEFLEIPVTKTDALHPEEIEEMTADMSPEEYAREMMCDFNAPIEGSYYAELMNAAASEGRIGKVPHDPAAPVFTCWDLGMRDYMSIWFLQRAGRELHAIDFYEATGKGLSDTLRFIHGQEPGTEHRSKYEIAVHVTPHDIKVRELGTGKSRFEVLDNLTSANTDIIVSPNIKLEDGIEAVRNTIPMMWFDEERCVEGIGSLRNYHRSKLGKPVHNWASHAADSLRTGCVGLNLAMGLLSSGNVVPFKGPLRRKIRGILR